MEWTYEALNELMDMVNELDRCVGLEAETMEDIESCIERELKILNQN